MSIELRDVSVDEGVLKRVLGVMIEARLLCDYFMDNHNRSEHGSCMFYSSVLRDLLVESMPEYDWELDGGWSTNSGDENNYVDEDNLPGGMMADYSDEYESHYWVKCSQLGIICDTSSSQFGTDNVYVTSITDGIYNPNLDADIIDEEIKYDTSFKPYQNAEIDNIKDPEARFRFVYDKILRTRDETPFLTWKEEHKQDYIDDLNDYFPDTQLKM